MFVWLISLSLCLSLSYGFKVGAFSSWCLTCKPASTASLKDMFVGIPSTCSGFKDIIPNFLLSIFPCHRPEWHMKLEGITRVLGNLPLPL